MKNKIMQLIAILSVIACAKSMQRLSVPDSRIELFRTKEFSSDRDLENIVNTNNSEFYQQNYFEENKYSCFIYAKVNSLTISKPITLGKLANEIYKPKVDKIEIKPIFETKKTPKISKKENIIIIEPIKNTQKKTYKHMQKITTEPTFKKK